MRAKQKHARDLNPGHAHPYKRARVRTRIEHVTGVLFLNFCFLLMLFRLLDCASEMALS